MQNKGIVKFIAVLLILVCCFYLSFSFVTRHYESKAAAMGEEAGQEYLDSINNEKVYMGIYSLKQCREMEIGLGLDLKGGMNVILEVSVPDVIDVLADHKQDAGYKKAMSMMPNYGCKLKSFILNSDKNNDVAFYVQMVPNGNLEQGIGVTSLSLNPVVKDGKWYLTIRDKHAEGVEDVYKQE